MSTQQSVDAEKQRIQQIVYRAKQEIAQVFAHLEQDLCNVGNDAPQTEISEMYAMFEQEFGRLLSPMELTNISNWLDEDHHSPELIKAALREAVIGGKLSLRYIDTILLNWKKQNITTPKQAAQHAEQFRKRTSPPPITNREPRQKKPMYDWLNEKE
ncbi:DnaD domain-containing protein [Metasolibacillus meyeri]|uniref:DnaD domain-containing protein n=1 Tax=Metasolibacillus meyeri TaxID=1071052 RepID=UPI000D2FB336|nr:DnaD domain protein [Metasolibacillus meyeri]